MLLTEEPLDTREGRFVQWFDRDGVNHFTYEVNHQELWDELRDPFGMPVATPETLEQARSIIEQAGHTIS